MKQYLTQHQKSFKDSYTNLPKFIPTKSILEKRTFGNLKPFPSLKHVRDAYARASNRTGKNITARFREEELREMEVNGNAESVYYALDEGGAYVGVNETICSDMLLFFGNNEVEKIKFFSQPKAKLHPMKQVNHNSLRIEGFNWETKFRPLKFEDLFAVWPERPIFRPPPPPPPTTPPAEELPEPPPENVPEGVDKAGTN